MLLVASTPSYEYRFLKHMLERDSTVDVRVLLQDADPDYAVIDQSALQVFPVRKAMQARIPGPRKRIDSLVSILAKRLESAP